MSITLQFLVKTIRRWLPRGWAPFLSTIAHFVPSLQNYKASISNGDYLNLDLRESMCYGIFFYGCQPHEFGTEKLYSHILKPSNFAVDIGANIGYYTRIASRLVGSNGSVFAFEPHPAAYKILKQNCADLENVSLFPIALSNKDGEATFYIRKFGDRSSLAFDSEAKAIQVKIRTADSILSGFSRIDLMKIDVEGFELEILFGAKTTINNYRPIVYFELLDSYSECFGFGLDDFHDYFDNLDYCLSWIDHSNDKTVLISKKKSNYVLAMPNEKLYYLQ